MPAEMTGGNSRLAIERHEARETQRRERIKARDKEKAERGINQREVEETDPAQLPE